jgi:DNA polymerase elongation subunit (family B)
MAERLTYKNFKDQEIEDFLNGNNQSKKHIVCIEGDSYTNEVTIVQHGIEKKTKSLTKETYNPFIYVKDLKKLNIPFYENDNNKKLYNIKKYKIKFKELRVTDINGKINERLNNGFKYLFYTESSMGQKALSSFFSEGGLDIYKENNTTKIINISEITDVLLNYQSNSGYIILNEFLGYNKVTENYEIIIKMDHSLSLNSIKIEYSGDFEAENIDKEDFLGLEDDNEEDEEVKPKSKGIFKKLQKFKDYNIYPDQTHNVYRITFTNKIKNNENIRLEYIKTNRQLFCILKPEEQYLVQKEIRLFSGFKTYDSVHKLVFDLETTGLDPKKDRIFAIGMKDNKGYEKYHFVDEMNDDEEKRIILTFFEDLIKLKPAIIMGHNIEEFDFPFIFERANILKINLTEIQTTLNPKISIKRKENSTYKAGNETIYYTKTKIFGINVIDTIHSAKKTQAINSEMKESGLKYLCKFLKVAKKDRMYVQKGYSIYKLWKENKPFLLKKETNDWKEIPSEYIGIPEEYLKLNPEYDSLIGGKEIIEKYLGDDLWETEMVDKKLNESTFMVGKYLPTSYERSATSGGAGQWNLIMFAWSYRNNIAIPYIPPKPDFTGGLSRTFKIGYFENIYKEDYAGLYPSIQLEGLVFPKHDVHMVLFRILRYFKFTRDKYKKLAKDETISEEDRKFYDTLQLPIKILNNSNFGAFGSEYFYWTDYDCAERITCSGRMYLRLMIDYFMKFGAIPIVEDSVIGATPIYLLDNNNNLIIKPIEELFDINSKFLDQDGLRDFSKKDYKILTRNGFKEIKYVYKHQVNKNIHTLTTKNRRIDITEDHSLFQNEIEVKPNNLSIGDNIDIFYLFNLQLNKQDIKLNEAWLYGLIVAYGSCNVGKNFQHYFKITHKNLNILNKAKEIIKNEFKITPRIKINNSKNKEHVLHVKNKDFCIKMRELFYTNNNYKIIPNSIINSYNIDIFKSFLSGYGNEINLYNISQVCLAGLHYILSKINKNFEISLSPDREEITKLVIGLLDNETQDNIITNNRINKNKPSYVYDISTEDGTFIAGIGGVICHNTDGCNFSIPEYTDIDVYFNKLENKIKIEDLEYNYDGKISKGVDAIVDRFNNEILNGQYMKLDNDGKWLSAINFARKNYANLEFSKLEDGNIKKIIEIPKEFLDKETEFIENYVKLNKYTEEQSKNLNLTISKPKFTGNSIKSKTMPEYIEDFIQVGIKMLLNNKGKDFIEFYYEYLTKIYCRQMPLKKIASKARIKDTIESYKNRGTDKNGRVKGKKIHMELIIQDNLNINDIEYIYYVNNGTSKSHLASGINKKTNKFYAYAITENDLKNNPDMIGEYNIAKYVDAFNTRIEKLLTVFNDLVRNNLIKKNPADREYFADSDMVLINKDRDSIEELFYIEEKEVKFWNRTGLIPDKIYKNYKTRYEIKSYVYYEKYLQVQEKLKKLGITEELFTEHDHYKNNNLVLKMETIFSVNDKPISQKYNKYIENEYLKIPIHFNNVLYEKYLNKDVFDETKKFYVCRVIDGDLNILKEV